MTVNPATDIEPYPQDMVVAIMDRPEDVKAAVEQLHQAGHDEEEVTVLCGEAGIAFLDVEGARHGILGRIVRTVQRFGVERGQPDRVAAELRHGRYAVGVRVTDAAAKQRVAGLLEQHGGRCIHHYGQWTIERLAA